MRRHWHTTTLGIFAVLALAAAGHKGHSTTKAAPKPAAKAGHTPSQQAQERLDRFWARAKQETDKSPEELATQQQYELRKGLRYGKLISGDPSIPEVALTFDDGPHPQYTPQILAILKRYNVHATFFVVGEMAAKHPSMVRAELAAGHVVGNHTYHHVNLTRIPDSEVYTEWQAAQDVVKSITGKTMRYCRPPGGDYDRQVITAAMVQNLKTVLWTDDPGDYANPGRDVIESRLLDRVSNGGIILIHDGIQQTINVLPQIIETLQKRGFKFVTVDQMDREKSLREAKR